MLKTFVSGTQRRVPRNDQEKINRGPLILFGGKVICHGEEFLMPTTDEIRIGQEPGAPCVITIGIDGRGSPYARSVCGDKPLLSGNTFVPFRNYLDVHGSDEITFPAYVGIVLLLEPKQDGLHVKWRRQ